MTTMLSRCLSRSVVLSVTDPAHGGEYTKLAATYWTIYFERLEDDLFSRRLVSVWSEAYTDFLRSEERR